MRGRHCDGTVSGLVQMDFWVLWVTLRLPTDQLRGPDAPKLPGNERFSSSPFQRMSKLSQRTSLDEVTGV